MTKVYQERMMSKIFTLFIVLFLTGCVERYIAQQPKPVDRQVSTTQISLIDRLLESELAATQAGKRVLETGRNMTLTKKLVLKGSCWDYANSVFDRAGYKNQAGKRQVVFKGRYKKGPYADAKLIQGGDFIYFINHSYYDGEHSAIFVRWIDQPQALALMLSYAGEHRKEPARYKQYDLSHVYRIIRAVN